MDNENHKRADIGVPPQASGSPSGRRIYIKGGTYVDQLKVGTRFVEPGMPEVLTVTKAPVLSDMYEDREQWDWEASYGEGKVVRYRVTERLAHYGPEVILVRENDKMSGRGEVQHG